MKYALLLAAALCFGCQDKPDPKAPASPQSGAPASGKSGAPASGAPATTGKAPAAASKNALLDAEVVLRAAPAQADIVLATSNLKALIEGLGRDAVVKAIPQPYAEVATALRRETGYDLLDPAEWAKVGVKADGPAGLFVITRSLTFGLVASLADAKAFQTWLSAQQPELKPIDVAGAAVYLGKWGPTLVVKKDTLILLGADRDALANGWGPVIASISAAESLSGDARVLAGARALGYGAHVGGFVDVQKTVDAIFGLEMRQANPDVPMLMNKARAIGQTEVAERLERFSRGRRNDIGEQMAVGAIKGMIFGQIGPMSLGVEVEGAALRLKADLTAAVQALPRRLIADRTTASPMGTLAGPKVALLGDLHLDIPQAMTVLQTLMMTGGNREFVQMQDELRRQLGLDLKADIIPAFTGEAGGALLLQDLKAKGEKKLGMTLFAGADPKKMQAVLDAIMKNPLAAGMIKQDGARYRVATPWRTVEFELKGEQLIITTDPSAFDRAPGRRVASHFGPTLGGALGAQGTDATFAMEIASLMGMMLLNRFDWEPPMPAVLNPDAETKALLAKRAALTEQIKAAEAAEETGQIAAFNEMTKPLGHLALTVSEHDNGLRIDGGLFTRGPYLSAVTTFATHAVTIDARMRALRQTTRDLRRQRRELDRSLREAPRKSPRPIDPEAKQDDLKRELK